LRPINNNLPHLLAIGRKNIAGHDSFRGPFAF